MDLWVGYFLSIFWNILVISIVERDLIKVLNFYFNEILDILYLFYVNLLINLILYIGKLSVF